MRIIFSMLVTLTWCCLIPAAFSAQAERKDAVALVDKGAQYLRQHGRQAMARRITNPATGRVEDKSTYVLRTGGVALEAGIYHGALTQR